MKLRYLVALALLPIMASCSKPPEAVPPAPAPAAAETPAPATESPAVETPPPAPAAPEAAAATPPAAEPTSPAPAAVAEKPKTAPPSGLVAGQDYQLIADGQPFEPVAGKIEVAEMFNYACPACNGFNPFLRDWKAKLPADVHLIYVPVEFRPDFLQYARAYYAAETLGLVEKTHDAVYEAIHQLHTVPGEGEKPDEPRIAAFYAKYGAKPDEFVQLMDGFAVNVKIAKAKQFAMRSRITSTPSIVVNGKYLIKGKSPEDTFRIADQLIASERGH